MTHNPAVSVIIPTYNRSHMVKQAVQSILDQTYDDYEVLVVDDGSVDDTAEVVAGMSPKVRHIYQPNSGKAAARNHGLREARGGYLAFLDDDDLFLPHLLQTQITYLETHPDTGMVYSSHIRVDKDLNSLEIREAERYEFPQMLGGSIEIATPTVMLRREVFEQVGYFDESQSRIEDVDYWVRVARVSKLDAIDEPLAKVRVHQGNNSRGLVRGIVESHLRILDKHLQKDTPVGWGDRYRYYENFFYWVMTASLEEDTDLDLAHQYARRASPYLLRSHIGRIIVLRMLFRSLVPVPVQRRLRALWR